MRRKHVPQRTCIGCGKKQSKYAMWRLVFRRPDRLILDLKQREAGRGAYLCPERECLERAIKRRALSRAFRCAVPKSCYRELERQFDDALST